MKASLATLVAIATVLSSTHLSAQNVVTRVLERVNVITTGDYYKSGETEGAIFVAGLFKPTDTHNVGFNSGKVENDETNVVFLNNGVSDETTGVTRLDTGSVVSRVSVDNSRFSLNGNGQGTPTITSGPTAWDNAINELGFTSTADLVQNINAASTTWRDFTPNSSGTLSSDGNTFNFTAATNPAPTLGADIAVFDVDSALAFQPGVGTISGSGFANVDTILINVSGSDPFSIGGNFVGDFQNNEEKIIFNFYEATEITLNTNFRGTIYAPYATLIQNGQNIDGNVVVNDFFQSAEVHALNFNSVLPVPAVPEPSSAMLLLVGIATVIARRRR